MTEDYKKGILDYISGNITPESKGVNSFRDNEKTTNDLTNKLSALGITQNLLSIFSLPNENSSSYLLYSQYQKDSKTYSWIAIANEAGEIQDILTTYESGMLIEPIEILAYDENGYIYGIDKPNNSSYYRIIQLNNMLIPIGDEYKCKLRSSYYINTPFNPPYDSRVRGASCIKKIPGEAVYYILGFTGTSPNYRTKLIRFSNIVGYPIEWNYYDGTSFTNLNDIGITFEDFIIETEDDKEMVDMYYVSGGSSQVLMHDYFDGTNIISKNDYNFDNVISDLKIEDKEKGYVAYRYRELPNNVIGCYQITNDTISTLFEYTTQSFSSAVPTTYINITNGILFSTTVSSLGTGEAICGAYYDNQFVQSDVFTYTESFYRIGCIIQKIYGLYKFILQTQNEVSFPTIVIYDNQYSGASYKDYNTTLPSHCEIYSNGYIKFARDLYNRQVYQNQCLSTANVPFNYLNDMEISPSNLIGASMTTLVSDNTQFEKNKYENLFINFMNKINVLDEDTDTLYQNTASYINENINTANKRNYEDTFIGKVQINFSTPQVQNIEWNWDTDHYVSEFVIYTSEIPTSIEYKSKDESTTYLIKELSNLSANKYYKISQKLRIE